MDRHLFTATPNRPRQRAMLTRGFLAAAALVALLIAPELAFGLQLRTALEPLLWGVAALAGVLFLGVVARARWHWASKVLAVLFALLCALALLLRIAVHSMAVDTQSLALGGTCVAQVTHAGAFGDYQDNVHRHCAVAGLWTRTTALASYRHESVAALALVPSAVSGEPALALTLTAYGKPPKTEVLTLP